ATGSATVLAETRSPAPAPVPLESRSGTQFIDDLYAQLRAVGLEDRESLSILFDVLNWPTLAVRKTDRDKGTPKVLQAVPIDAPGSSLGRGIVWTSLTITATKPP